MSKLEKRVTAKQVRHSYKNVSQLEKCVTVRKVYNNKKNVSQLEKCVTAGAIIGDGDRKRAPFLVLGLAS